ncbi:MAG TPA: methyl-accepting chemotaxis protein [Metalysinibacillus jejuensis]|uniref:Methyl-accepting chemotaxis protein n=1 Tax=Metalysinibacillus jejuensis TaxID=914327 RepID=A0A921NBJ4_9BACL|nr:methyl-accepting chemotaxis protein [Metalysinibacillus jejuensis]
MSLRTKLNVLVMSFILLISLILGVVTYVQSDKLMRNNYEMSVTKLSNLSYSLLDEKLPGDWAIKNNELYKGTEKITNHVALIDDLGQQMDGGVTVFQGTKGLITTLELDGQRLTGKDADPVVIEAVMNKGETYIGEADVVGTKYLTLYSPLKNAQGDIVGMWFVGEIIDEINQILISFITKIVVVMIVVLLIAFVVSSLLTGRILRPLARMKEQIQTIAAGEGDLTKQLDITAKDEIGEVAQGFNQMIASLRTMMTNIASTATDVTHASNSLTTSASTTSAATEQVTTTMQAVAGGAEQSVTSITESVTALQEMAVGVQQVAETTATISDATSTTSKEALEGNEALNRVREQMNAINTSSKQVATAIGKLDEQSNEIGNIVAVITGIADQTNLLALNAAIEAARAGEQGKGFAVVADEVRKLAEQSKHSADQIASLITQIQTDTKSVIKAIEGNARETAAGMDVVVDTQQGFAKIKNSIDSVNAQIHEVSAVTEQMSAGVEEITASAEEVARISGTISDNMIHVASSSEEQLAAMTDIDRAAQEMARMSASLQQLINRFTY